MIVQERPLQSTNYIERSQAMDPNIIAVLPEEVKGKGICARIYTETKTYIDSKTPELFLDHQLKEAGRSKKEMDKIFRQITQIQKNTPYIIGRLAVFFPHKHRKSPYDKHGRGFVNVRYVSHIEGSQIVLITGETIDTLSKFDSLNPNKNAALMMMYREHANSLLDREESIRFLRGKIVR